MIRPARSTDIAAILGIWNHAIRTSTATFTTDEKSPDDIKHMIASRPVLVVEGSGFASYGPFRSGPGYAGVVEHTVYVEPAHHRRGLGRALLAATEAHAEAAGNRILIGGLCGENTAARALHEALGFEMTAQMPDVGRKFGRTLDLIFMQKNLGSMD